ncbi:MAG: ABC transporter permease subunit [Ilumatobacteraceae bacterium]
MPLWRDVRVIRWIVQLAVVAVVAAIVIWLYGNYTTNAAQANIPTNFDFLDNPASFQITGNSLSQSAPVRDALFEGLVNTLRVCVAAIVAATILGTLVGIGRLSSNWIVRKIATVYVEVVRNIPLALFLVAGLLVIVLGVFPNINEAWDFLGLVTLSNRGLAVPWFQGGSGRGLLLMMLVGALLWWAVARWRRSVSDRTGAPARSGLWGGLAFVVVMVVGWFAFGYTWSVPAVEGRGTTGGMRVDPSFFALFFALVIYTASHIAEIVRGSIQAVHHGQTEAACALNLSNMQRIRLIVLPQAFRIMIPPLANQFLNLTKNSSLAVAIGYYEITRVTQTAANNAAPAPQAYSVLMVLYLTFSLSISLVANLINRHLRLESR